MGLRTFQIGLPVDTTGMTGRECPSPACLRYFKIQFGTGLTEPGLPCHCPYCGHSAPQSEFFTQDQIEYATSVVGNQVLSEVVRELKKSEFSIQGPFGLGISMKVEGRPGPVRHYREKSLETEIVCESCTLRYAIYGVFAFCPDCGAHNSLQILVANLEIVEKQVQLAASVDTKLSETIVSDALENAVSCFDAFGREVCRVNAGLAVHPDFAESISFQSLSKARDRVLAEFGHDLASCVTEDEWAFVCRCFQKRHLVAHRMGVVDEQYIQVTRDATVTVGRKIEVRADEVHRLVEALKKIGSSFAGKVKKS